MSNVVWDAENGWHDGPELAECSECGHEHYVPATRTYLPCPLRGEGCPCNLGSVDPMSIHHYVKTGLAGYGPDLDIEDEPCDDIATLCAVIGDELNRAADSLEESASFHAETEDYETAWRSHALAMELDTLRANLDYEKRSNSPLYLDSDPTLLYATMMRIIGESFPLDITPDGYTRLYVFPAQD